MLEHIYPIFSCYSRLIAAQQRGLKRVPRRRFSFPLLPFQGCISVSDEDVVLMYNTIGLGRGLELGTLCKLGNPYKQHKPEPSLGSYLAGPPVRWEVGGGKWLQFG